MQSCLDVYSLTTTIDIMNDRALVNYQNKFGKTALMVAAERGLFRHCALLLHCKANSELVDKDGNTALIIAALHGHVATCAVLVLGGCDVNHVSAFGQTAYVIAGILIVLLVTSIGTYY